MSWYCCRLGMLYMSIEAELTCHSVAPTAGIAQQEVLLVPHLKSLTPAGYVVLQEHLLPTSPAQVMAWLLQNLEKSSGGI